MRRYSPATLFTFLLGALMSRFRISWFVGVNKSKIYKSQMRRYSILASLVTLFAFSVGLAQQPHTLTGDIRLHKDFHSQILSNNRHLTVYLPSGYDSDPKQRYPVLYFHDGQNLF